MSEATFRLQADYLTCSLCSQPFRQPKTLPCLHNFCKACLASYLEEQMSGGRGTTFTCPECRTKIYVPDPSKPVNRWAAQFPTNFTLSGMIEAIAQETEAKGKGVAMVKEARARRGLVPDTLDVPDVEITEPKKKLEEKEKEHSQDSAAFPGLEAIQSRLSTLQEELRGDEKKLQQKILATDSHASREEKKIEQSFSKIYMLLEARKSQLQEELSSNLAQERDRLEQARQGCNSDAKSLESCQELLDGLGSNPVGDDVVYDMLQAIGDQVQEIDSRRGALLSGRSVKFEQTLEAARSVLNLINDLGQISISTSHLTRAASDATDGDAAKGDNNSRSRQASVEVDPDRPETKIRSKPKFLTAISTQREDGKYQQIYDLTVTANGVVVMTCYGSNVLIAARKSGSSKYSVYASLELDSEPKCVTAIAPFYVAVTGTSCIYLVAVDETLKLQRRVNTGKDYQGITMYNEASMIAVSQRPACIDFVAISGFISETVDRDHTTGKVLLRLPQFIATSREGVIYVTDGGKKPKLISVNNAGLIRFQCPSEGESSVTLDAPQGVGVDRQGHVFVVDRAAKKVILITPEGEKVKDILTEEDGLTDPCSIAVDQNDLVYVTNEFNEVLVFQVR